jgi:tRNA-modifying protein YgfZ
MDTLYRLDRTIIEVSGVDAHSFLQGLLTQNLNALKDGDAFPAGLGAKSLYAALLTPQGKVLADMILRLAGSSILIDVDSARAEVVAQRLHMYQLRSAVTIEPDPNELRVGWSMAPFEGAVQDPRLPELGWRGRLYSPHTSPPDGSAEYDAHRIALGVPDLTADAQPEEVFALEALLEELNGVDFQKGCFVGQENVSRMKRRATTRKKFCPVVFDGEPPPYGTPVRAGEAELGSIRTGVAGRAIALLRLDRALEAAEKGQQLTAGEKNVRLDPPAWLFLPARDD